MAHSWPKRNGQFTLFTQLFNLILIGRDWPTGRPFWQYYYSFVYILSHHSGCALVALGLGALARARPVKKNSIAFVLHKINLGFFRFTRVLEKKEMPNFKTFFWSLNRLKETTPFKVQHLWERFHWFQLIRWLSSAIDVHMRSRPQVPWTKKKLQLSLQILFRPMLSGKKLKIHR